MYQIIRGNGLYFQVLEPYEALYTDAHAVKNH